MKNIYGYDTNIYSTTISGNTNNFNYASTDDEIKKAMTDEPIYPSMVIRSQAETIELLEKKLNQYKNNWEELKKWLKEEIERLMKVEQSNNVIFLIGAYDEVLSKMKELEEDK